MQDLTQGKVSKHIITLALPIFVGLVVHTLYLLVDLYFVARLGSAAIAAVSTAASVYFCVMAFTQVLNIGCATLVSHAVGRRDKTQANHIFNQGLRLSIWLTLIFTVFGYAGSEFFLNLLAADPVMKELAKDYFAWFLPSLLLQFVFTTLSAALRGTGIVKPVMSISILGVVLNIILSPIFIEGWPFGEPLGVIGAGLASSISMLVSFVLLVHYFQKKEGYLTAHWFNLTLEAQSVRKLLNIGLPSGGEFFLTFLYMSLIYWALSGFSAEAQAGFGLGARIMHALFLPVMAIAFAAPAIAGQNYAAGMYERVQRTYKMTAYLTCSMMAFLMVICLWVPEIFAIGFTDNDAVIAVSASFLSFVGLNFVPAGYVFTVSGMFQAMGNTWPALLSNGCRLTLFAIPLFFLTTQDDFNIEQIWYCSVVTVFIQAFLSHTLLKREFSRKLRVT